MSNITYYAAPISKNRFITSEGYLICKDTPICKGGKLLYPGTEIGLKDNTNIMTVFREDAENANKLTLASFEGKPITDDHPSEFVTVDNFNYEAKGHAQNVRFDNGYILADLFITDKNLINDIIEGIKKEVSCGYFCEFVKKDNVIVQTNIRGNHIAIVKEGRAGSSVSIKDSKNNKGVIMMEKKSKIKNIVNLLAFSLKGVETNDEASKLVDNATETLMDNLEENKLMDNLPPAPAPTQTTDNSDMIIAELKKQVEMLIAKVDEMSKQKANVVTEDSPEAKIEEAIKSLESSPTEVELELKKNEQGGEQMTDSEEELVKSEEVTDEENTSEEIKQQAIKDTALTVLRSLRTNLVNIQDENLKIKVVDGVMKSLPILGNQNKTTSSNSILQARKSYVADTQKIIANKVEQAQANYDKYNPHNKQA